jgi:hypothetical protein
MGDLLRRQWHELRLNLHPRECFYWFVQNLIRLFFLCTLRVQLFGGEHYAPPSATGACERPSLALSASPRAPVPAPATLLFSGHKRDWDPLTFATTLYYQRGWWRPDGRRMAFAGREDMFTPGFLAEIVGNAGWPRWAQHLLDLTALKSIIGPLRAYPIARYPEFGIRHYLFEVKREQGNLLLSDVFSDEFLDRIDRWTETLAKRKRLRPSRELRISDVLNWSYRDLLQQRLRPRLLLPEQWQRFKTLQRAKVQQQLQTLAGVLKRGDTLWLAAQGHTTENGAIGNVRLGVDALLTAAPPGTRVLPTNITLDFMTTGRIRVCIAVGPPLELEKAGTSPSALETASERHQRILNGIAQQTVVTMSQVGSRFLWNRLQADQPVFDLKEALAAVAQDVQSLAGQAAHIERGLLDEARRQKRLRAFLTYAVQHGLLRRVSRSSYQINPAPFQQRHSTFFWLNPRYCVNELEALEIALAEREGSKVRC